MKTMPSPRLPRLLPLPLPLLLPLLLLLLLLLLLPASSSAARSLQVGTLSHADASFTADVRVAYGYDGAAYEAAQRAELRARASGKASALAVAGRQATVVVGRAVGTEDTRAVKEWEQVQQRLRGLFGEAYVQPHAVGQTVVFAERGLEGHAVLVEEVMQWEEVVALVPWMPEHKVSPVFDKEQGMCGSTAFSRSDGRMELTVTTTPMDIAALQRFSEDLQKHLWSSEDHYAHVVPLSVRKHAIVRHDLDELPASTRHGAHAKLARSRDVRVEVRCDSAIDVALHLAEHLASMWVEPRALVFLSNKWAAGITQTGAVNNQSLWDMGLTGADQVVGVSDTGLDASHCFFYDPDVPTPYNITTDAHRKIVTYIPYVNKQDEYGGHGSHVCGSVLGETYNSSATTEFNGMAYGAKLAFFDIGDQYGYLSIPSNINNNLLQPLFDAGATIISNSWGAEINYYDVAAKDTDQFMWDNPSSLVLFAAGNSGESLTSGSFTVGTPTTAKSIATIGCTSNAYQSWITFDATADETAENFQNIAYFSSQGPTRDGRLKPDVMAPGYYTTSTFAKAGTNEPYHCNTLLMEGTSMATPTTAGNTALIREYFQDGYYPGGFQGSAAGCTPSGALMKGILMQSAVPMGGFLNENGTVDSMAPFSTPNNYEGFGRIDLSNVLYFDQKSDFGLWVAGAAESCAAMASPEFTEANRTHQYKFQINSLDVPFQVKLVWTDYPPLPGMANASLVNDLALRLVYLVELDDDYFDGAYFIVDSMHTGDPYRFTEVTSESPSVGDGNLKIFVSVTSKQILQGPQPYSLVVTGDFEQNLDDDVYVGYDDNGSGASDDQGATDDNAGGDDKDKKSDDDDDDSSGLSSGKIAGATIGAILGATALGLSAFFIHKRMADKDGGASNYNKMDD